MLDGDKVFFEGFQEAAELGDKDAQFELGLCYYNGLFGAAINKKRGLKLFLTSAEQRYVPACLSLGKLYHSGDDLVDRDETEAQHWFALASSEGDSSAQYQVGKYLERGRKQLFFTPFQYYKKAAMKGHLDAQCSLSCCYEYGEGVERNYELSRFWLERAASMGSKRAKLGLARRGS